MIRSVKPQLTKQLLNLLHIYMVSKLSGSSNRELFEVAVLLLDQELDPAASIK